MSIAYAFYVLRLVFCVLYTVFVMCQWPMALYHK